MLIPKIDEFFDVTAADLKIDSSNANKDKSFIRVVSPLMPNKKSISQSENTSKIDINTSNDSKKSSNSTGSDNASSNNDKEKKRGWLW